MSLPRGSLQRSIPYPLPFKVGYAFPGYSLLLPSTCKPIDRVDAFRKWIQAEGLSNATALTFTQSTQEGVGLAFSHAVQQGDCVLTIPERLFFRPAEILRAHPELYQRIQEDALYRQVPSLHLVLALLVEQSRGAASPWRAYLDFLPTDFTIPICFAQAELWQRLKGSLAYEPAVKLFKNVLLQFLHMQALLTSLHEPPFPSTFFDWSQFVWATAIAMTRQNEINHELVLVPVWDLCNHCAGEMTTVYDASRGELQLFASQDTPANEPFYMYSKCYGMRDNLELFLYSGFVDKNTPHDHLPFPVTLPSTIACYKERMQLLQALLGRTTLTGKVFEGLVMDTPLRQFLSVVLASEQQLRDSAGIGACPQVDLDVLQEWLKTKCTVLLRMHHRSLHCMDPNSNDPKCKAIYNYRKWECFKLEQILGSANQ